MYRSRNQRRGGSDSQRFEERDVDDTELGLIKLSPTDIKKDDNLELVAQTTLITENEHKKRRRRRKGNKNEEIEKEPPSISESGDANSPNLFISELSSGIIKSLTPNEEEDKDSQEVGSFFKKGKHFKKNTKLKESKEKRLMSGENRSKKLKSSQIVEVKVSDEEEVDENEISSHRIILSPSPALTSLSPQNEIRDEDEINTPSPPLETSTSLLGLPEASKSAIWRVTVKTSPRHKTKEDWEEFKKITYTPSIKRVPLEDKHEGDLKIWKPEEDGIFMDLPVPISSINQNLLEQRIIKEKSLKWFGLDGKLICVPDPIKNSPEKIHLITPSSLNPEIKFIHARKITNDYENEEAKFFPKAVSSELVLKIGTIKFTHHHLFSKEHVLAQILVHQFQNYSKRMELSLSERAENKICAVRDALNHAKEIIYKEKLSSKDNIKSYDQRLNGYRNELIKLRKERDDSLYEDKCSLKSLLKSWKELRSIRHEQNYSNTNVKLKIISVESHSREDEIKKLDEEIENEYEDLKEAFDYSYAIKYKNYKSELRTWKKQQKLPAEKPFKSGETETVKDEALSKIERFQKPNPPSDWNEISIRDEITQKFYQLKKRPGEPRIICELLKTNTITSNIDIPESDEKEIKRRKVFRSSQIQLRLILNEDEIYRSDSKNLTDDFSIPFNLSIPVLIDKNLDSIKINIWETGGRLSRNASIALVSLKKPSSKMSIEKAQNKQIGFSSTEVVKNSAGGVGSGVEFIIKNKKYEGNFIGGDIEICIGWGIDSNGSILSPKFRDQLNNFDEEGFEISSENLKENAEIEKWMENMGIDPNDPKNAHFLQTLSRRFSQRKNSFKIDNSDNSKISELCPESTIENSHRLKLLKLRDEKVQEFRYLKMIPASEYEILPDVFTEYEERLKSETARKNSSPKESSKFKLKSISSDSFDEEGEMSRMEKIRKLRLRVFELFQNSEKELTFEDIVLEEQMSDIGTFGLNIISFFQAKRPLRPIRKERKRLKTAMLLETKLNLIINVVRAINLPLRKDDFKILTTESITGIQLNHMRGGIINGAHSILQPFVEVWFQRKASRTSSALGPDPTWNQELQLPLLTENEEFSINELSKIEDMIYLHVYDEVAVDILEDDRRRTTDIHQRLEKRWLGSITIPFTTLFINGKVEGTFKLFSPPILLGYEMQKSPAQSHKLSSGTKENVSKNAYLTVFITLDPPVSPPSILQDDLSMSNLSVIGESEEMMSHVKKWYIPLRTKFSERLIKPLVLSPEGDAILCMRYLKPLEPPEDLLDPDSTLIEKMEDLARFVSLFPSVRDVNLGVTDLSLWVTSDVFVSTPGGGTEDHSVLLACFFLHLNVDSWIIQGSDVTEGPSTYVLTSFKKTDDVSIEKSMRKSPIIWNALTGDYFHVNDSLSSLEKVWSIVGSYNIWANISTKERPDKIDWDLEKSSNWCPLFSKISEEKLPTLQPDSLSFTDPDQNHATSLAQRLERYLKECFMKWRKSSKTNWNRHCSTVLRRILPTLEDNHFEGNISIEAIMEREASGSNSTTSLHEENFDDLREIMKSYKMTGFPLNEPYRDMESVVELVHATGVHTIDTPDVEFSLAVYAMAYPSNTFSLWVYIAALHKNKK